MRAERIDLYRHFSLKRESGSGGYLDVYAPFEVAGIKPKLRPAMLVIAGGAYTFISQRESAPVAVKYVANGYCAFVLDYSVNTAYPVPLVEACMAVAYIRENASKYRVDKNLVAAIGFSAGGHLATMLANIYDEKKVFERLGNKTQNLTPWCCPTPSLLWGSSRTKSVGILLRATIPIYMKNFLWKSE